MTTNDLLLGFFQLESDLSLHRYSTFQRTPGSTSECPPAATWLDPDTIRERARTAVAESDQLEQPILSYHGNRDRIAWRVPIANRRASIYVVGRRGLHRRGLTRTSAGWSAEDQEEFYRSRSAGAVLTRGW